MKYQDRIKELRRVKASTLVPNPKNWRTHPVSQRDALSGILETVGIADAVLATELSDGRLMLVDGHLRQDLLGNDVVPVLVLDLSPEEADMVLLTHDPLASLAGSDKSKIENLISDLDLSDERFDSLFKELGATRDEDDEPKRSHHSTSTEPFESPSAKFTEATEIFQYTLVFEKREQRDKWFDFVRWLNENVDGETIGERISRYIEENDLCISQ